MYTVGEQFEGKKQHACGGKMWTIIRVGADYKIKCNTCNRELMLEKHKLDKMIKNRSN
ncbi:MAG: DUF951 domain-containing protein [Clostridia bacterium]|nr:DUF951 domain-containing protein [Clostridia bacterium]